MESISGRVSLIGCGVMGGAIARAIVSRSLVEPSDLLLFDLDQERAEALSERTGAALADSASDAVSESRTVILAVKPFAIGEVARGFAHCVSSDHLVISAAAGISTASVESELPLGCRVIRAMPNTPGLIGKGVTAVCQGSNASEEDVQVSSAIFAAMGEVAVVAEGHMDCVTAISGSGPAYYYLMIEAMAEAGVLNGLPRDTALKLATGTAEGAAAMVSSTGEHPALLRSDVTSPSGTTAEALRVLEKNGFRSAILEAVSAAVRRSREIGS